MCLTVGEILKNAHKITVTMIIAYVGNFIPEHSTENHVRQAWQNQGHTVVRVQEGDQEELDRLIDRIADVDLVLWTRTADLAARVGHRGQWRLLAAAERADKPTVGFHLDRWWGLNREASVWEEPFFRCRYVITADGGHQEQFASVGVNHVWLPPAVSLGETEPGTPTDEYRSPLAFVGSWQGGYHQEWTHRADLVRWLQMKYPRKIQFWPRRNEPGVRGEKLRNIYASVDVVIGDSCLAGGVTHYWSDRIPETLGRGGFLLHPYVEGLSDYFNFHYKGEPQGDNYMTSHLGVWDHGDWKALRELIDLSLEMEPENRRRVGEAARRHVIENHTYDVRVNQILEIVK